MTRVVLSLHRCHGLQSKLVHLTGFTMAIETTAEAFPMSHFHQANESRAQSKQNVSPYKMLVFQTVESPGRT